MTSKVTPTDLSVIPGMTKMLLFALSDGVPLDEAMTQVESRLKECLRRATQEVLEQRSVRESVAAPTRIPCACGGSMLALNGRHRKRTLDLSCGPVTYGRAYYAPPSGTLRVCDCEGRFPVDEALRLARGALDPRIVEKLTLLSVMVPYQQAVALSQRLLSITLSKKRAVTTVSGVARSAFEQLTARVQRRWDERDQLLAERPPRPKRKGRIFIMTDGTCVGIKRSESFKECKSAVLFWEHDLQPRRKRPGTRSRRRGRPDRHLTRKHIVSLIGSHEEFLPYLWDAFVEAGGLTAQQVILIADGAHWIWTDGMKLFPDEHFEVLELLDWYHLFENLWKAARELFQDPRRQRAWIDDLKKKQRGRNTGRGLADELRRCLARPMKQAQRETVEKVLGYIQTNSERMRYVDFRQMNWPRGSAAIESVNHGVIQARFKLPGMRWTVDGANAMLCLRNAYFSGRWDIVFHAAMRPMLHAEPSKEEPSTSVGSVTTTDKKAA